MFRCAIPDAIPYFLGLSHINRPQIAETNKRVVFTDGNQLLAWCNNAQDVIKINDSGFEVWAQTDGTKAFDAGRCYGLIIGVVQTTPVGRDFSPGPDVRGSQYLDVVTAYLKAHPNIRDKNAADLTVLALVEALPKDQ